jgi:hypothetical protein
MNGNAWKETLGAGTVIPAAPLALSPERRLDERRQRALVRYYHAAGAGGLAVGVHTTQFRIRDPAVGLFEPVLKFVSEVLNETAPAEFIRVAGVCGKTGQAIREAETAREFGYQAGLLSLAAWADESEEELLAHCREVGRVLPLFGFYLQPSVGVRVLPYSFWRRLAEEPCLLAVKIAPFNRYQTLDVVRAVSESSRCEEIALYTGNDDNIVIDLLTHFRFKSSTGVKSKRIVGGLLGHWAVWTRRAVELLKEIHELSGGPVPPEFLTRNAEVTDCNAALFDPSHGYKGCIPGIHYVLKKQGFLDHLGTLDPEESLSPGQAEEIERVRAAYPHLLDDVFVAEHLDEWLG